MKKSAKFIAFLMKKLKISARDVQEVVSEDKTLPAEAKPQPKPTAPVEPNPQDKPAEPKPQPKPIAPVESNPQDKPAELKPQPKPTAPVEPNPQDKPAGSKPQPKPTAPVEPNPQDKPAESKPQPKPTAPVESKPMVSPIFANEDKIEILSKKEVSYAKYKDKALNYATYKGKVLGIVFESKEVGKFVLALRHNGYNKPYQMALHEAEALADVGGKKWIVPSDTHFKTICKYERSKVDKLLEELGGHKLYQSYLSSSSQANPPARWEVRFVLPL